MATTFEKKGSAVLVTRDGNVYSVPGDAFIFPDLRDENTIVISSDINPQNENHGLRIDITTVETPTYTDRNNLIELLTENYFAEIPAST